MFGLSFEFSLHLVLQCDALLIRGGTVVNAHHKYKADVYVEDGIIK